jgi:glycosyltransferase involved in cell wall biosynthesis
LKISIVTAVYNGASTLADTIDSIAAQTHPDVEHIVIDGGSTDGTQAIVQARRSSIARFVSERDKGVYDAMNKGIRMATGEVVATLNSDDIYASPNVLQLIAERFQDPEVDICYGDLVYVKRDDPEQVVRYWRSCEFDKGSLAQGWYPAHPTFFARRQMFETLGAFSPDFPIGGDVELMIRFLSHARKAAYIPQLIARMRLGGISNAKLSTIYTQNVAVRRALRTNSIDAENLATYSVRKLVSRLSQFVVRPHA